MDALAAALKLVKYHHYSEYLVNWYNTLFALPFYVHSTVILLLQIYGHISKATFPCLQNASESASYYIYFNKFAPPTHTNYK